MTGQAVLDGVVVAELGGRTSAGVCGTPLSQLGATVVVPEWAGATGSKHRHRTQLLAGKLSLVLRRDAAADLALLERLVSSSEVLILSSDLDPAMCAGAWPKAETRVECDVTAFGDSGPMRGMPYSDAQVQALSGILDTTGMPDGPPTPIRLPNLEFMTGVYAAASCLSALRVMKAGGGGQAIDMSLYGCAFAAMATFLPRLLDGSGATVGRAGNRHAMASPWNVYRALDGWVLFCAGSDVQWRRICALLGRPELTEDPRYARVADRVARHGEVDGTVQDWIALGTIDRCLKLFEDAGIACGPVAKVDGYPREANLEHRGAIRLIPAHNGSAPCFVPASPLRMSRTPGLSHDRVPEPDEDRAAILALLKDGRPGGAPSGRAVLPLAGVRVLEFGHYTTAPLSARHLANLGADVIKIEPREGEAVRNWPPAKNGTGYFFTYTNSDKRSLALDLEAPGDTQILRELVERSDVLIENLKPGALVKRGFSAEEIARINPRLIYCAVSGFGGDTVYPGRPAYDTVVQAMSGFMDLTRAGDVPVKSGISSADLMGGGDGRRRGSGRPRSAGEDRCRSIHRPIHAGRRVLAHDDIVERGRNGPAPVLSTKEMLEAEQTIARNLLFHVEDEDGDVWPLLASPLRLKGTPPVVKRPMGRLGSNGPAILAELGRSQDAEIELVRAG